MSNEQACAICGNIHPLDQFELTFELPEPVFILSRQARTARCKIGEGTNTVGLAGGTR
jgi:hypothetical protein